MRNSIWIETSHAPQYHPLHTDASTDVLIIGGGIAGVRYMLVEADRICRGVTCQTTAKITAQHGLIYDKLLRELGIEAARMYLEANQTAVQKYRELCRGIDCDFEDKDSFVYATDTPRKLENELKALE